MRHLDCVLDDGQFLVDSGIEHHPTIADVEDTVVAGYLKHAHMGEQTLLADARRPVQRCSQELIGLDLAFDGHVSLTVADQGHHLAGCGFGVGFVDDGHPLQGKPLPAGDVLNRRLVADEVCGGDAQFVQLRR